MTSPGLSANLISTSSERCFLSPPLGGGTRTHSPTAEAPDSSPGKCRFESDWVYNTLSTDGVGSGRNDPLCRSGDGLHIRWKTTSRTPEGFSQADPVRHVQRGSLSGERILSLAAKRMVPRSIKRLMACPRLWDHPTSHPSGYVTIVFLIR